jgi:hypothetical protein
MQKRQIERRPAIGGFGLKGFRASASLFISVKMDRGFLLPETGCRSRDDSPSNAVALHQAFRQRQDGFVLPGFLG